MAEDDALHTARFARAEVSVLFERDELLMTVYRWQRRDDGPMLQVPAESWRLTPEHAEDLIAHLQKALADLGKSRAPVPSDIPRH